MGAYHKFSLTMTPHSDEAQRFIDSSEDVPSSLKTDGDTNWSEKWYESHEFMLDLSEQFPETLFELNAEREGDGEDEPPGEWTRYYKAGEEAREDGRSLRSLPRILI